MILKNDGNIETNGFINRLAVAVYITTSIRDVTLFCNNFVNQIGKRTLIDRGLKLLNPVARTQPIAISLLIVVFNARTSLGAYTYTTKKKMTLLLKTFLIRNLRVLIVAQV